MRDHELEEDAAVAGADRETRNRSEQDAVRERIAAVPSPSRMPPAKRER